MDIQSYMHGVGREARKASQAMARANTAAKNHALTGMATAIEREAERLLNANARDLDAARTKGLAPALLDRLTLSRKGVASIAEGLRQIALLPDPVGEVSELKYRPAGFQVGRMRVPLGVVGIIYEARPSVTADAAGLCLKAGNAAILRGGSEALESNQAIAACVHEGLRAADLPSAAVQVVETTDRAAVGELLSMKEYVDIIVPRGGKGLIERVSAESRIPVLKHLDGVCHVYIDRLADPDKAIRIADNAKTQRLGTCNTMETLLVATDVAPVFLPQLGRIFADKGVEMRCCPQSLAILARAAIAGLQAATEQDWRTEHLAPILSIRVVSGIDAAIEHINTYGSHHTDAIVTTHHPNAMRFLREVDSASVMINASTRFADGFEYGLGAEIGISNDKLHARGPVGLEGLTSLKYVVFGDGQVRG